jgi:hypothetical protein
MIGKHRYDWKWCYGYGYMFLFFFKSLESTRFIQKYMYIYSTHIHNICIQIEYTQYMYMYSQYMYTNREYTYIYCVYVLNTFIYTEIHVFNTYTQYMYTNHTRWYRVTWHAAPLRTECEALDVRGNFRCTISTE